MNCELVATSMDNMNWMHSIGCVAYMNWGSYLSWGAGMNWKRGTAIICTWIGSQSRPVY